MDPIYFFIILFILIFLVLGVALICFLMTFAAPPKKQYDGENIPKGKAFEPYRDTLLTWLNEARTFKYERVSITSKDGLKLRGRYYQYSPGATIELLMPGYKGNAERDLSGGVHRCFSLRRNAFLVDQRGCGESEGKVITFGIKESEDCLLWIDYITKKFGEDQKIILTGISMGAATVLMTSGKTLPQNVVGVIADCGYSSPKDIIKKVITDMKLPSTLLYPFVRLGGLLYGHFDIETNSPAEAVENSKIPIVFIHGQSDTFVPCYMSRENHSRCRSEKLLLEIPDADHGLCYMTDPVAYADAVTRFF